MTFSNPIRSISQRLATGVGPLVERARGAKEAAREVLRKAEEGAQQVGGDVLAYYNKRSEVLRYLNNTAGYRDALHSGLSGWVKGKLSPAGPPTAAEPPTPAKTSTVPIVADKANENPRESTGKESPTVYNEDFVEVGQTEDGKPLRFHVLQPKSLLRIGENSVGIIKSIKSTPQGHFAVVNTPDGGRFLVVLQPGFDLVTEQRYEKLIEMYRGNPQAA